MLQTCPLCRAELPPGLDGLYDLGARTYKRIRGRVNRGELSWAALPAAQQVEMDEAAAVLTEAADQGHMLAQAWLAQMCEYGQGVARNLERAVVLYQKAAEQGHARSRRIAALGGMVEGRTSLYVAAWSGHLEVVRELVGAGGGVELDQPDGAGGHLQKL